MEFFVYGAVIFVVAGLITYFFLRREKEDKQRLNALKADIVEESVKKNVADTSEPLNEIEKSAGCFENFSFEEQKTEDVEDDGEDETFLNEDVSPFLSRAKNPCPAFNDEISSISPSASRSK